MTPVPSKYVDATHNILYTLNKEKWLADLAKSDAGDITGYQEAEGPAQRAVIREHCVEVGRGHFHPTGSGNPITWNRDVFTMLRLDGKLARGVVHVHASAPTMGVKSTVNPARDFTWVGLNHKPTGKKVLRINVHPAQGATKLESDPTNTDSVELSKWKDWGIGQYWLDVLSFAAGQMSLQDPGVTTTASLWDIVTIGGDYNAYLNNRDRWYYPGVMLPALFVPDKIDVGLDHLQHAHGADVKLGKRWSVKGNSDHRIQFQERTILNVTDFPRK